MISDPESPATPTATRRVEVVTHAAVGFIAARVASAVGVFTLAYKPDAPDSAIRWVAVAFAIVCGLTATACAVSGISYIRCGLPASFEPNWDAPPRQRDRPWLPLVYPSPLATMTILNRHAPVGFRVAFGVTSTVSAVFLAAHL